TVPVTAVVTRVGSPPPPPPPSGGGSNPPSNLQLNDQGNGTILVSWADNSTTEDHFVVERNPAQPGGYQVTSPNVTSVSDPAAPGTYAYRVYALTGGVASAATPWQSITVGGGGGGPAAPSNLRLMDMGNGAVQVLWSDNSSNEDHFVVERSPAQNGGYQVTSADQTSALDAAASGTFSYRV